MVRRIIEGQHAGLVTFESEPCKGTTVRVRLPRRAEPGLDVVGESGEELPGLRPATRASTARTLAAALAFLGILAAGFLLAWLVTQR